MVSKPMPCSRSELSQRVERELETVVTREEAVRFIAAEVERLANQGLFKLYGGFIKTPACRYDGLWHESLTCALDSVPRSQAGYVQYLLEESQ